MNESLHYRIKLLIEETNDAFYSCGHMNTDFADFASLALGEFRHALRDPRLSPRDLRRMLRDAMCRDHYTDPDMPWSNYVTDRLIARHQQKSSERAAA